jgi:hypothetical protein
MTMKAPGVRFLCMVGILFALGAAAGQANIAFAAEEAGRIEVPEDGTAAERAKALWKASRPVILADAKANYSDAEYMKRRGPVWNAWTTLQMSTAGEDDRVSKLIPDILGLLNDVYGWTANPPEKRQEIRDRKRKFVEERIVELDKRMAALK